MLRKRAARDEIHDRHASSRIGVVEGWSNRHSSGGGHACEAALAVLKRHAFRLDAQDIRPIGDLEPQDLGAGDPARDRPKASNLTSAERGAQGAPDIVAARSRNQFELSGHAFSPAARSAAPSGR